VAQMVARPLSMREVMGSTPIWSIFDFLINRQCTGTWTLSTEDLE